MRRRDLVAFVASATSLRPLAGTAQPKTMPVIGYLTSTSPVTSMSPVPTTFAAFRLGLGDAGYVEGQNVVIEYRSADGHYDQLPALAADLVGRKVD